MNKHRYCPKILILTMSCEEPQLKRNIKSVKEQEGVTCDHVIIENKPNIEAHKEVYDLINKNKKSYDYFIKLDADMEFTSVYSARKITAFFNENVDHLTIPVFDYFIRSDMPALHVFSNRVTIDTSAMDGLYVDNVRILYPGNKLTVENSMRLVLHCHNPSEEQAFAFGVHRALKIIQKDRSVPNIYAARYHYSTLNRLYNLISTDDDIRLYSLYGAKQVFDSKTDAQMTNKSEYLLFKAHPTQMRKSDFQDIFNRNEPIALFRIMGFFHFFKGMCKYVYSKLKRKLKLLTLKA